MTEERERKEALELVNAHEDGVVQAMVMMG